MSKHRQFPRRDQALHLRWPYARWHRGQFARGRVRHGHVFPRLLRAQWRREHGRRLRRLESRAEAERLIGQRGRQRLNGITDVASPTTSNTSADTKLHFSVKRWWSP